MALTTLSPSPSTQLIRPQPFTPTTYAPYGTCITSPLPPALQAYPSPNNTIPPPRYPTHQPTPVPANQNTALKTPAVSPLIDNYHASTRPQTTTPQMSMFSTFPRSPSLRSICITHLERHPYTSQTFTPLALPADSATYFLVVSAPTLTGQTISGVSNPPDVNRIEAFVARGDQAVTYAPGTWHAPMIVVGSRRVDFVVVQFGNGVDGDDCEIVEVGGEVGVDVGGVGGVAEGVEVEGSETRKGRGAKL